MRDGGYVIDFWGVGYRITERMGLTPRLMELGYQIKEVRLVDARGRKRGGITATAFGRLAGGRFTSLRRSDLSAAIYGAIEGKVETIFGDGVAAIEERPGGVRVAFDRHPPRDFDLVVGADGLHSRVREMVFGPERELRGVSRLSRRRLRRRGLSAARRASLRQPRHAWAASFALFDARRQDAVPVRLPRFLAAWPIAFDRRRAKSGAYRGVRRHGLGMPANPRGGEGLPGHLFRPRQPNSAWRAGSRPTALVGRRGGVVRSSPARGQASGSRRPTSWRPTAPVDGDASAALARYEDQLLPFLRKKQQAAAAFASSFAPASGLGIALRNLATRLMGIPFFAERLMGHMLRDDIELPDYAEGA